VSPNRITDSVNGFLTGGLTGGHSFTTDDSLNPGPFVADTVVAGIMTLRASDVLTTVAAGVAKTITMLNEYVALPSDFWGLCDGPGDDIYVEDYRRILKPLPNRAVAMQFRTAGMPLYYDILNSKMYVYPASPSAITIQGMYFQKPTAVTTDASTMPFNEIFDDIIAESVVAAYKGEPLKVLQGMVYDAVDAVVRQYDKKAPTEPSAAIDWSIQ
jgi:hypothetical protein